VKPSGDHLLTALAALAHPHRLRILAILTVEGRRYVSQLAREMGISRPLLKIHLGKLEAAGLVSSEIELSADGKALNFFDITPFEFTLNPMALVEFRARSEEGPDPAPSEGFC
jgi:predicted transcriptional regulator